MTDPVISKRFATLADRKVIKWAPLIKSLFYFLGYKREEICLPGTQQLFWKTAKHLWNADLLAKMAAFDYHGAREQTYKVYQTVEYVERNTSRLDVDRVN